MRHNVICVTTLIVALSAPLAYGQAPTCGVTPTALDFGTVVIGSYRDTTFTIENIGTGQVGGSVIETCDHYSIVFGGGSYKISAGESVTVTVRFEPTSEGTHICTVETGSLLCGNVNLTGVGIEQQANEPGTWGRIKSLYR